MSGNKHDNGVLEQGTDEIRISYQEDTIISRRLYQGTRNVHEQKQKTKKHFSQVFGNPLKDYPYNEEFQVVSIEEENKVEIDEEEYPSFQKKADKSGMPLGILKQVYRRGLAAYKTGHRPGATAPQWAMARVNSFITKGKGTWGKADSDLAAKVRGGK